MDHLSSDGPTAVHGGGSAGKAGSACPVMLVTAPGLAMGGDALAAGRGVTATLVRNQVPFAPAPTFADMPAGGISNHHSSTHDSRLLSCGSKSPRRIRGLLKAMFDHALAALLLILLSPLLLVLCALTRLDGGPVFFGHCRIGRDGRHFRCLKFRTMTVDADTVLRELLAHDPAARAEWQVRQKLHSDPRVTRIGCVLRETSLDELPQLLNVLRGEMSLVGPRPIVDAEVERYGDRISFYYEMKPGITGLWQVSGRSTTSYEHRIRLDVWYARNWTLWHDLVILLKTVPAVLLKIGAV